MRLIVIIATIALSSCIGDGDNTANTPSKPSKDSQQVIFSPGPGPFSWYWMWRSGSKGDQSK